jgi:NADH dehydrogenase [ubiquinone] 1 alpha subcomplex assembly factor 1
MPTETPSPTTSIPGIDIFTFGDNEPRWYTVDDSVMGGISRSRVELIAAGILSFTGTMSLENNGGFSSMRSEWSPTNLNGYDGVVLRVSGDGQLYRLRIRTAETGSDIAYNAIFETSPNTWELIYIPFESMVPTYRGFVMDVDPLDPGSIGSFGFMLSDKQDGEFELFVDWIRAVSEQDIDTLRSNE